MLEQTPAGHPFLPCDEQDVHPVWGSLELDSETSSLRDLMRDGAANPCDRNPVLRYGPGPLRCTAIRGVPGLPATPECLDVYVLRLRQVACEQSRRQRPARQQTR